MMRSKAGLTVAMMVVTFAGASAQERPKLTGVSHLSVYSSDMQKSEHFYVHDLGATRGPDPEDPSGVRYYFNARQFVEVLPLPASEQDSKNRFHGAGYNTSDAEGMRKYLAAHRVAVPETVTNGSDGSKYFTVKDPEGNSIEFEQLPAATAQIPDGAVSKHIIHVGYIVHDVDAENAFYETILGFRAYWHGGMKDDAADWISEQLPDGNDWVEFMTVKGAERTGIPTGMSQETAGVLNHFALGVPNIEQAYNHLYERDGLGDRHGGPQLGRDGKWQLNIYDPDGTRAEFMEFQPAEKPCCSPFLLPSPTE